jgi:hypothetical protein
MSWDTKNTKERLVMATPTRISTESQLEPEDHQSSAQAHSGGGHDCPRTSLLQSADLGVCGRGDCSLL